MSTQQALAQPVSMPENSVIKHYKKQLIYRQHDILDDSTTRLNDFHVFEKDNKTDSNNNSNKRTRRKRKNKNCRGQFRHEGMELIKLGANQSHSLCKPKDTFNAHLEKSEKIEKAHKTPTQPILERHTHVLPQMIPDRFRAPYPPPYPCNNYRHLPPPEKTPVSPPMSVLRHIIQRAPSFPPPNVFPPFPGKRKFEESRLSDETTKRFDDATRKAEEIRRRAEETTRRIEEARKAEQAKRVEEMKRAEELRRAKRPEEVLRRAEETKDTGLKRAPHVVAAIDLTVEQSSESKDKHKCKCQCGKTYVGETVSQEVIIKVGDSSKVPSHDVRGRLVEGDKALRLRREEEGKTTVIGKEPRMPQMFRIEDLLAKGVPVGKQAPVRPEPRCVIVAPATIKDHSVSTIMGGDRRRSVDIDTISVSSNESSKSNSVERLLPHGKLCYIKSNHSFVRYFEETQKLRFFENISDKVEKSPHEDCEVFRLPEGATFSLNDDLNVEEYVSEMFLVERFVPRDFFLFYKFVTGYQICNNNLPVSFLTFLKVYNTNGLRTLLERYASGLKSP